MINHFIYLNSGPIVNDFFFNHGGEKFEPSHLSAIIIQRAKKDIRSQRKKSKLDKYLWFTI
jgi:hypothetical protein